ncbi:MAG: NAD-dependent epimerase/dehydratase family protein [Acidimicrobiia bacterium]
MRVLVIGGTHLSGPFLVEALVSAGHEVFLCHRGEHEAPLPPEVAHIHGDKADLHGALGSELRALDADVVVHMVAFTRDDGRAFMDTFGGHAGRVVVPSSADVYRAFGRIHRTEPGSPDPVPLREDAPLRERLSIHGEEYEKRWVEAEVLRDTRLPGTVLRYPAIYGPGDRRLSKYVQQMVDDAPVILLEDGEDTWRFARAYAANVAHAALLAVTLDRSAGEVFNVAEQYAYTEREWVEQVAAVVGWHGEIVTQPAGEMPPRPFSGLDWRQDLTLETAKIRTVLGYTEPVDPSDGIRSTVVWERANPPAA